MKKSLLTLIALFGALSAINAQDWMLYGTTAIGGSNGAGIVFSYDLKTGKDSTVLTFNRANGSGPFGNVTVDPVNGMLYGVTRYGGADSVGVLFSYDPVTGKDSTQVLFNNTNGANPIFGSLLYFNKKFYGMTLDGGSIGYGTLYSFDPVTGKDSVYLNFGGGIGGLMFPYGTTLTQYGGMLYGMCNYAVDANNDGGIFRFNPATGTDTIVVSFDTVNGQNPGDGGLTIDPKNNILYGMTLYGGTKQFGVITGYTPSTGKDSAWYLFDSLHGMNPYGNLIYDTTNGLFYGLTVNGGHNNFGVLFSFNPATGIENVEYYFDSAHGSYPTGNLVFDTAGVLYGTTSGGGANNDGVMFSFNPTTKKDSVLITFNGANGASPQGSLTLVKQPIITAVKPVVSHKLLSIYPVPFTAEATITFSESGIHYIEMYDVTGRQLNHIESNGNSYILSRNGLASGIYFVKIYDSEQKLITTRKVVIE